MGYLDSSGLARFKSKLDVLFNSKLNSTLKGSANGLAELNSSGKVPENQLPSYVDDVVEYPSFADLPGSSEAETGKIYVTTDTNKTYRWSGTTYVAIDSGVALGETSSTAYRGDRGKAAYDHASENGKVTTPVTAGLYKVSVTGEGHIGSADAVTKSDIELLGIPGADTWRGIQDNLTSNGNTTDSLSANQGYLLANGAARDNSKRSDDAPEVLNWFKGTPRIDSQGGMEVGKQIDFHATDDSELDYSARISADNTGFTLTGTTKGTFSGDLTGDVTGDLTGNADTATQLETSRSINGTNFDGTSNITTNKWGATRTITVEDADSTNSGTATDVDGSGNITLPLPSTIKASLSGNATTATTASYLSPPNATAYTTDGDGNFTHKRNTASDYWHLNKNDGSAVLTVYWENGNVSAAGTVTAAGFSGPLTGNVTGNVSGSSGSCTGNAATATTLQTARSINGTNFNGSAAITTAKWGTARNITIKDSSSTNSGTAVSVDGSGAITLLLPATIKASITGNCSGSSGSCTGNAATATKLSNTPSNTTTFLRGDNTWTSTIDNTIICIPPTSNMAASNMAFNGGIQVRENGAVGSGQSAIEYGPRISFHWANRIAKSITLHSNGTFYFRDQNGTGRSTIDANVVGNVTGNCSGSSGSCTGNAATATKLAHTTLTSTTINNTAGSFAFSGSGDPWSGTDWVGLQIGDNADKFQITANGNTLLFRQNDSGGTNTSWSAWVTMLTSSNYTSFAAAKTEAIKSITRSGTTFTATRCDGTTFTFTQQDNNTTYSFSDKNVTLAWGTKSTIATVGGTDIHVTMPANPNTNTWRGIQNNLTSTSTTDSLSAAQGKALNEAKVAKAGDTMTGVLSITNTTASSSTTTGALKVSGGVGVAGNIYGAKVYNAVWNDYAECRKAETLEPGRCVYETDSGIMKLTEGRLQAGCKLTSDTYGTCMGKTEEAKTPIAVAGRVLAYPFRDRGAFHLGDAVCSAPGGTVDVMTRDEVREYPERIVGIVSEIPNYETWQAGTKDNPEEIPVNGRIWIYVR